MKILFATTNPAKVAAYKEKLEQKNIEILTIQDIDKNIEVEENGSYEFLARCENGESDSLSIDVTEIAEISADNPYIPEGFSVINDSIEEGFVIEDGDGNQYVWVPVENGKLERENALDPHFEETGGDATALVNIMDFILEE